MKRLVSVLVLICIISLTFVGCGDDKLTSSEESEDSEQSLDIPAIEDETDDFRIAHLVMTGDYVSGEVKLSREHMDYKWVRQENALDLDLCDFLRNLIETRM